MKRFLVLAAFACAFTGCKESKPFTDPLCDTAIKAITGAAQGVAGALGCANLPAVAAAMSKPVKDLAICKEGQQGLIGDIVCPQVGNFVMDIGLGALPADWQCSGGTSGEAAKALIVEQCKKAVTF